MLALFYQRYGDLVGDEVMAFCLNVLNSGASVKDINETLITLIPKVFQSTRVMEFRPISLCSVLYKILSKLVVNRMMVLLPVII